MRFKGKEYQMNVEFKHNLKDIVRINALNITGIVVGYYYSETGITYKIAYFLDGSRAVDFLYEEEISKPSGHESAGYSTR